MPMITLLRLILISLLLGAVAFALLLANGLADPPRAGELRYNVTDIAQPIPINTSRYTLIVAAELPPDAPYSAAWGIALFTKAESRPAFTFEISADGYFRFTPNGTDFRTFPHLRVGQNELTLHVEADGTATIRLNREIAWRGNVPQASTLQVIHTTITSLKSAYIQLYTP